MLSKGSVIVVNILAFSQILAVEFTNVTNEITITDYGNYWCNYGFTCSIIDYVDPVTNEKYDFVTIQNEYTGAGTKIESDIFSSKNLNKYNESDIANQLPFIVKITEDIEDGLSYPQSCKNPVTNDIIVCYEIDDDGKNTNIECKIYFNKLQKWSQGINVTGPNENKYNNALTPNGGNNLLCFDDSYFIIYLCDNGYTNGTYFSFRYTLIDLNGNSVIQNAEYILFNTFTFPFITKSNFANNRSNFTIEYEICTGNYNCSIMALFGFYTNIKDINPIGYFKNSTKINLNTIRGNNGSDVDHLFNSLYLDITDTCCYITPYLYGMYDSVSNVVGGIWMSIFQYDGTQIFKQDINVINTYTINVTDTWVGWFAKPMALPMINNNYFIVLYVLTGELYGKVYQLTAKNANDIQLELENEIKLIDASKYDDDYDIQMFQSHIIDENMLILWTKYFESSGMEIIKGKIWSITNS
eukprot:394459_1